MKCKLKLLSSLEKIFFAEPTDMIEHTSGSMLKNEIYSFQLACWGIGESYERRLKCRIQVESELEPYIQIKQVGYVPSFFPAHLPDDEDYITKMPNLFPDPLSNVTNGEIEICSNQTRALWISVEPKGKLTGTYPIVLKILGTENEVLDQTCFTLEIINAELPELDICNTGWFHGDCIAELHKVELLSDAYFDIVEKYIKLYVKFGHNMILTPVFTPPLDTAVGKERPTNQLVEVTVSDGHYEFGFSYLKRWVDICRRCGVKYFEISHLFTQWGAEHAPKIMATVDGEYRQIFGWETEALSEEYRGFLDAFLPALIRFLEKEEIIHNCYFHVSDEPIQEHEPQYKAVKEILLSYIEESKLIDALSDYSFYEKGIVTKPVVGTSFMQTFLEHGAKDIWAYYCNAQGKDVSNRFMAMPSYRNRILGYQLYKYDMKGFLHWGFNFWFTQFSAAVINPYIETSAGGAFQSGDAFIVYPLDNDGEVVCSLRLYVFNEGMQDMRALRLLEQLTDRQTVEDMLKDIEGFGNYPRNSQYILKLREQINRRIQAKCIQEEQDEYEDFEKSLGIRSLLCSCV